MKQYKLTTSLMRPQDSPSVPLILCQEIVNSMDPDGIQLKSIKAISGNNEDELLLRAYGLGVGFSSFIIKPGDTLMFKLEELK